MRQKLVLSDLLMAFQIVLEGVKDNMVAIQHLTE